MKFTIDPDKLKTHGLAQTPFYILATPRKIVSYEKHILLNLFGYHGYLFIGPKRKILELIRLNYSGLELEGTSLHNGQVPLFISNKSFEEVQSLVNSFIGGRYPKPGTLAPQTVLHPAGIVHDLASANAAGIVHFLKKLGHAAVLQNGRVFLPKPCIVFEQGDVLNQNQCELARILLHRIPEYKLRITHMWTPTEGFSIFEPKVAPLMQRLNSYHGFESTVKMCKEEYETVNETETGWKSIKRKADESYSDRISFKEKSTVTKMKLEFNSTVTVCKEENETIREYEIGWKSIKQKEEETCLNRISLSNETKIKQEPIKEEVSDYDSTKNSWVGS